MKSYVVGLLVSAAASAVAFVFVLLFLNPNTSAPLSTVLLMTSLYIFITSMATLLGFVVRVWLSRNEIIFAHLGTAFRQGLLLGLVLVGSLVLQLFRIFNIWSGLLFVAGVILIELAFQSHAGQAFMRGGASNQKRRQVTDVVRKPKTEPWQTRISQK